jgi:hypothetical protein
MSEGKHGPDGPVKRPTTPQSPIPNPESLIPRVIIERIVSINHRTGATWLRRGYEIEERVPRFHFLVKPVENSQLRILTTLSLLNNQ